MKREFPIEKGFQIVVFFLMEFWEAFLKDVMVRKGLISPKEMTPQERKLLPKEQKEKDGLHYFNSIVFITYLGDPAGPGNDFKEVVKGRLNIDPLDQRYGTIIDESMFFQLTIDFCKYYNREYQEREEDYLRFAIDWLEDMRNHPEKHKIEWKIWEKTVDYVLSSGDKHLIF